MNAFLQKIAQLNALQGDIGLAQQASYNKSLKSIGAWVQRAAKATGLSSTTGSDGGYAVPAELYADLMSAIDARSIVRRRCTTLDGVAPQIDIPSLGYSGETSTRGGVAINWLSEGDQATVSNPSIDRLSLVARKAIGFWKSTNELLSDSAAQTIVGRLFVEAMSNFLDGAFLAGDGVAKPLGVLNSSAIVKVQRQTANQISKEDVAEMVSHLLPQSVGTALAPVPSVAWIAHPKSASYLLQSTEIILTAGMIGAPVLYSEHLPTLGSEGDLLLCDFSYYLSSMTQDIAIARSAEHNSVYLTDESLLRVTWRGSGAPWVQSAISLENGTHSVSPFVVLTDPAA
jgi:HK97 family phage major capsid protein